MQYCQVQFGILRNKPEKHVSQIKLFVITLKYQLEYAGVVC